METPIPSAIIFINETISNSVKDVLIKQLFITESITGDEFDNRLLSDPNYVDIVHLNNKRILVLRSFIEPIPNNFNADIIMFIKNGLASIISNKIGPYGYTTSIQSIYLFDLMNNVNC